MWVEWAQRGRSHLGGIMQASCSYSAKLVMTSVWRLSWAGCPVCPTPMPAVDASSYWLEAQQESIRGLQCGLFMSLHTAEQLGCQRDWKRASTPKKLRWKPWDLFWPSPGSHTVSLPPYSIGQKASPRASPDSRGGNYTRSWILGGMFTGGHLWGLASKRGTNTIISTMRILERH